MTKRKADVTYSNDFERFQSVVEEVVKVRNANGVDENSVERLKPLIRQGYLQCVLMKKTNRISHNESEDRKRQTLDAKKRLDVLNLQLQNLIYERNHYLKEIQECKSFVFDQESLELVTLEKVCAEKPDVAERLQQHNDNESELEHQRLLERLNFELMERRRMTERVSELEARKKALEAENSKKHQFIDGLREHLREMATASLPMQAYMEIPATARQEQSDVALLLPAPLYLIFQQVDSYVAAFKHSCKVRIDGNVALAKAEQNKHAVEVGESAVVPMEVDEGEAIDEEDDEEDEKKKSKKARSVAKEDVLNAFPLSVVVEFDVKQFADGSDEQCGKPAVQSPKVTLNFLYLPQLNIITVAVVSGGDKATRAAQEVLTNLYPNDTGAHSPNPCNEYQSASLTFDHKSGRPYKWAQWLGGLDFLPLTVEAIGENRNADDVVGRRKKVSTVLPLIARRLQARVAVSGQIKALKMLQIPISVKLSPMTPSTRLSKWEEISAARYKTGVASATFAQQDDDANVKSVEEVSWQRFGSRYFCAVLTHERVELEALVEVSSEYPLRSPQFKLRFTREPKVNDDESNQHALYSEDVRKRANARAMKQAERAKGGDYRNVLNQLEGAVNLIKVDDGVSCDFLLSYQLLHLVHYVDVLVLTMTRGDSFVDGGKFCLRAFRGRDRRLPLKFNASVALFEQE